MIYRDYEEFLASLNANNVRYLVVGAHAVGFHARPRATKDIDIYIDPTAENAARVLEAIRSFFGGADLGFKINDLTAPDSIVQLGVAPLRIDILSTLTGIENFEAAWEGRVAGQYGGVETHYISLDHLIQTKQAAGRDQDRVDLRALRRAAKT